MCNGLDRKKNPEAAENNEYWSAFWHKFERVGVDCAGGAGANRCFGATAGMAGVWITSAACGIELSGSKKFSHAAGISTVSDYAGICCNSNTNIQLVFKISDLPLNHFSDSSKGVIMPSSEGTTMNFGETIFEQIVQIQ